MTKTIIDHRFKTHFKDLKQVFLYVIDDCNLKCLHCLYKPDLIFHRKEKEMKLDTALTLLSGFREMGASKLTILGGEPTLFGASENHEPLLTLISKANEMGYEYIRIDTNGQFEKSLLLKNDFRKLNEITFGLDGHTSEINDYIRGDGAFEKCVSNIKEAIKLGYNVDITTCIHKGLTISGRNGNLLLNEMIEFASTLGVNRINFHDLFKTGIPRDSWTGDLEPSLEEWTNAYAEIQTNIKNKKYNISVRLPQCFIAEEEFEKNSEYFGYCPAKMGERVLVHPNGIIRICSLMIGTPYGIARYYDNKIVWDDSATNELYGFDLNQNTPCTNQSKSECFKNLVPLCVSFKPSQKEFVWQDMLHWESKKRV